MPQPADLVLCNFPFTNMAGAKTRPALVIADAFDGDLLIARVTSQSKFGPTDVALADWQQEGLRLPSWAQLSKLTTIESSLVITTIGRLSRSDRSAARTAIGVWIRSGWM